MVGEPEELVKSYLKTNEYDFPLINDLGILAQIFLSEGFPTNILINPAGTNSVIGGMMARSTLEMAIEMAAREVE